MTITNGTTEAPTNPIGSGAPSGGGILQANGTLNLNDVAVTGNTTGNGGDNLSSGSSTGGSGGSGGGIHVTGTLVMTNSVISNNTTGAGGAGASGGTGGRGAGLFVDTNGTATLQNVTIIGNTTGASAGPTFPTTMTPAQFVDKLFLNAGVTPTTAERNAAINEFGSATTSSNVAARGRALRDVAENGTVRSQEFNRAFVLMEYFGYLRRNPNDAPESTLDYTGYEFWLTKLNQFNGNYINAEMVKAFLSSIEYRQRFGPWVSGTRAGNFIIKK